MVNSGLENRERAYRDASRGSDYFVTGLSLVLFLASVMRFEVDQLILCTALDTATVVLFVSALLVGLKKLEYTVAVLGADYSVGMAQADQANLTVRESTAVLRDLNETIERLSGRAAIVHVLRNWMLGLGLVALTLSRILDAFVT